MTIQNRDRSLTLDRASDDPEPGPDTIRVFEDQAWARWDATGEAREGTRIHTRIRA